MEQINIGLLGCGTVGTGVSRILLSQQDLLASRVGAMLVLKRIADPEPDKKRSHPIPRALFTTDAYDVVNDPEIDIIIELIGGTTIACELVEAAIQNGKQVVTANKALLAEDGNRLFALAREKGVDIAFEASVAGCIPIIKTLRESLVGNEIFSMNGILNGTCNFILTRMTHSGASFEAALKEAQDKGFAEADPTLDIEGIDAAHKLALLSALAWGTPIDLDAVYVEGINGLSHLDVHYASEFGYRVKLIARAENKNGKISTRVHPAMIPLNDMLSNVEGSFNALSVKADAIGEMVLYGHGAGMMPTASAVVSDTVDQARNLLSASGLRFIQTGMIDPRRPQLRPVSIMATEGRYYFRFSADDRPGVFSRLSGILAEYGISIQSVQQMGRKKNGGIPIVMITHMAKEAEVQQALDAIRELPTLISEPVMIRILEEDALQETDD
ncbi:MAG: homoserine dehydrogenase [Deltaproteobacteria bacterium]|nr:MAG: homoserine dehydrogenase [Deltaproteobacteria bacterium]